MTFQHETINILRVWQLLCDHLIDKTDISRSATALHNSQGTNDSFLMASNSE